MNIVLEGPDGGGKSTLARLIADVVSIPLIEGNGPPKSRIEFRNRCLHYLGMTGVLFDRHPCISEAVYGPIVRHGIESTLDEDLVRFFWETKPFIVYVRPYHRVLNGDHVCKKHETEEHVEGVKAHHADICEAYDEFMLRRANYIYRQGDDSIITILKMASDHMYHHVDLANGPLPHPRQVRSGDRWYEQRSRAAMGTHLRSILPAKFEQVFCNKCGYVGLAEVTDQGYTSHQKVGQPEPCVYEAVSID